MDAPARHQITDDHLAGQRLRLWMQMLKATRHVEGALRERLRVQYGTTLPRFDVLAALHAAPDGLRMSELSDCLVVSNGNVTGVVDRLVADDLAERRTVESDRRAFLVRITPEGQALMTGMVCEHLRWIDELLGTVAEVDAARGISIMLDIRHRK